MQEQRDLGVVADAVTGQRARQPRRPVLDVAVHDPSFALHDGHFKDTVMRQLPRDEILEAARRVEATLSGPNAKAAHPAPNSEAGKAAD